MEIPIKSCRECKFSKGGNYLAAANGNNISVFNFYTGERVADFRGHNGKVRSLHWLESGCNLLSCGQDGTVYIWEMDGSKKCEYVQKGVLYTSVVSDKNTVYAVGSDRYIRQVTMPDFMHNPKFVDAGTVLGCVAMASTKTTLLAT
jgi:WD40 repeat protein